MSHIRSFEFLTAIKCNFSKYKKLHIWAADSFGKLLSCINHNDCWRRKRSWKRSFNCTMLFMQLGVGGQQYSSQSGKPCLIPISWYCHEQESLTKPIRETDGQNSWPPSSTHARVYRLGASRGRQVSWILPPRQPLLCRQIVIPYSRQPNGKWAVVKTVGVKYGKF